MKILYKKPHVIDIPVVLKEFIMGAILALLMALDIISGSSSAKAQSGGNNYSLSSSSVSGGSERYSYTDDVVKESGGRIVYEIKGSSVRDSAGRSVFSVSGSRISGSDSYEVRNKKVLKNNKVIFDLN